MKKFNFNKPLIESPYPPKNINAIWVRKDIDGDLTLYTYQVKNNFGRWRSINDSVEVVPEKTIWFTAPEYLNLSNPNIVKFDFENKAGYIEFENELTQINDIFVDSGVSSIKLPVNLKLTSILDNTFKGCQLLTSFNIPDTVTSIGSNAFKGCGSISNITIPKSVVSLGDSAFSFCTNLTNVEIPEGITDIPTNAFEYCTNLKKVKLPKTITNIESGAFANCVNLIDITLQEGITTIKTDTFKNCKSLKTLTIPESVTTIEYSALSGCKFDSFHIPANIQQIQSYFYVKKEITVDPRNQYYDSRDNCNAIIDTANNTLILGNDYTKIPETVSTLDGYCFEGCTFTEFEVPAHITTCGGDIFNDCKNLKTIIWNSPYSGMNPSYSDCFCGVRSQIENFVINVSEIPTYLLVDMPNLQTITIGRNYTNDYLQWPDNWNFYPPKRVTVDPDNPIYDSRNNCDAVIHTATNTLVLGGNTTVIPDTVTSIASYAFLNSKFDNTFVIPPSIQINSGAFYNCSFNTLIIPSTGLTGIGECLIHTLIIPEDLSDLSVINEGNSTIDNVIWNAANCSNQNNEQGLYNHNPSDITSFIIGPNVQTLPDYLCKNMYGLTTITIPESVTSIGEHTFEGCVFAKDAFINNSSLDAEANNYWGATIVNYTHPLFEIEDGVLIQYYGNETNVIIPDGVTTINSSVFEYYDTITSITIPASVTHIGNYFGSNCPNLTKIYYKGSVAQWCNIDFASSVFDYSPTKSLYINDKLITDLVIPSDVKTIKQYAFAYLNLNSLSISQGVAEIGYLAFRDCGVLQKIYIPDTVTNIDSQAFYETGCEESNFINKSSSLYTDWYNFYLFKNGVSYDGTTVIKVNPQSISIVIPEGVTEIRYSVFTSDTLVETVTLPKSLQTIDSYAFNYESNVKLIKYNGTMYDWYNNGFNDNHQINQLMQKNTVVQCSNGTILK